MVNAIPGGLSPQMPPQLLGQGTEGAQVEELQKLLNLFGLDVPVTGRFGEATKAAVMELQKKLGVKVDGIVGPETMGAMGAPFATADGFDAFGGQGGAAPTLESLQRALPGLGRSGVSPEYTSMILDQILGNKPRAAGDPGHSVRFQNAPSAQSLAGSAPTKVGLNSPSDGKATFDRIAKQGRNQMVEGTITVNGNQYKFRSGGGGDGNLPPGQYTVTKHMQSRGDNSMSVGGVGYSFALSDKFDPRVGRTRELLRIHPDGGSAGTIGCIGIVGDAATQAQFRRDMNAAIERNGGRYTLNVG